MCRPCGMRGLAREGSGARGQQLRVGRVQERVALERKKRGHVQKSTWTRAAPTQSQSEWEGRRVGRGLAHCEESSRV